MALEEIIEEKLLDGPGRNQRRKAINNMVLEEIIEENLLSLLDPQAA